MSLVDPWGSTNQGLATLGDTFDTLNTRRRQDIQDTLNAEKDRREAEKDAIGMESARLTLDEQRRKVADLRSYDEARKAQETGFATATVPTEVVNPAFRPEAPGTVNPVPQTQGLSGSGAIDPADIYTKPAEGLPTMEGTRPLTEDEKNQSRIQLAMSQGNLDEVAKLGHFIDVTDKIDARAATKIKGVMAAIESVRNTLGPQAALWQAKKMAKEQGMDPALADQMVLSPQGIVSVPDGQGGTIITMRTPDGKDHVVHSASREPKSPSQIDIEMAASKGDPVAIKMLSDQEARKIRVAKETKSVTVNGLTVEENAALTRAVEENRLNPDRINSRTAKVYAQMELKTPGMSFAGKAADIGAGTKSLANQTKVRDMMGSFVRNMDTQAERLRVIAGDVQRYDSRLLNVPLVKWRTMVAGSPMESKVDMYVSEISAEIAKLSTGSSASVAELTQSAREKWDKIHDKNLSMKDLLDLIGEVQHAGKIRMDSANAQIEETRARMRSGDSDKPKGTPKGSAPIVIEVRKTKDGRTLEKLSDGSIREAK
jgi:hypothetical protein